MPEPIFYDKPHEKLAREEGKRLVDMYSPGTEPHQIGQAILLVLREKREAELELRKAQRRPTTHAPDGEYVAPCGCHGNVLCDRHAEWFNDPRRR